MQKGKSHRGPTLARAGGREQADIPLYPWRGELKIIRGSDSPDSH
jgi:hypothetical protein